MRSNVARRIKVRLSASGEGDRPSFERRARMNASTGLTATPSIRVVGNLPYNISTPLICDLLDTVPAITRMFVMVQREVGERLREKPSVGADRVVEGAGGIITDWDGKPLTLHSDGKVIASSNKDLHEAALVILSEPRT